MYVHRICISSLVNCPFRNKDDILTMLQSLPSALQRYSLCKDTLKKTSELLQRALHVLVVATATKDKQKIILLT